MSREWTRLTFNTYCSITKGLCQNRPNLSCGKGDSSEVGSPETALGRLGPRCKAWAQFSFSSPTLEGNEMGVETCISDWTLELNKRFRTQRTLKGREVIRALGGGTPACLYRKHFMNMTRKYKIFFKMQAPDPRQESPYVISAYICQFRKQTPSWLELLVACNDSRQGRSSFSKPTVHLAPPQHE